MTSLKTFAMGAAFALATAAMAQPASAAFTLVNDNGGDGYVVVTDATHFDVFGADNGVGANTTEYFDTAATGLNVHVDYIYTTNDCCGAFWDPAGYFSGLNQVQLSPPSSVPGYSGGGSVTFHVNAGDEYGFYVYSPDSVLGRADLAVSISTSVPEPAMWAMMIVGFGLAGATLRRRKLSIA